MVDGVDGGPEEITASKERVQVVVRVRPQTDEEASEKPAVTVEKGTKRVLVSAQKDGGKASLPDITGVARAPAVVAKAFNFDACLDGSCTQADVFAACDLPALICAAMDGFAVTVFAFGQTGAGKTYTVTGPAGQTIPADVDASRLPAESGLVARALVHVYGAIAARADAEFKVTATYNEIYNERVTDLLVPPPSSSLAVRHSTQRGFFVEGLTSVPCPTLAEAMAVLNDGLTRRRVGAHLMNRSSSRSHAMMTLYLDCCDKPAAQGPQRGNEEDDVLNRPARAVWRFGKICFVDLAGSERLAETGNTTDVSIKEAGNINRSLFALGKVIAALSERGGHKGGAHVPFRDSKLTQLLIDSLQGSGRALMLACCSPQSRHADETINTLHFASLALHVRSRPVVILDPHDQLVIDLRKTIVSLRNENKKLLGKLDELAVAETRRGPMSPGNDSHTGGDSSSSSSSGSEDEARSPVKDGATRGEQGGAGRDGGTSPAEGSSSEGDGENSRHDQGGAGDASDARSPCASDGGLTLSDGASSGRRSPSFRGGNGRAPKPPARRTSRLSSSTTAASSAPGSPSTEARGGPPSRGGPGSRSGGGATAISRGSSRSSESSSARKKNASAATGYKASKGSKQGANGAHRTGSKPGAGASVAPSLSASDFHEFPELAALEQAFQANLQKARAAPPPDQPPEVVPYPSSMACPSSAAYPELAELEAEFQRRMVEARGGGAVPSQEGDVMMRAGDAGPPPGGAPAYRYPFYTPMPSTDYPASVASFLPSALASAPARKPKPKAKKPRPASAKSGNKGDGGKLPTIPNASPQSKSAKPASVLSPEQKAARWAEVNKWFGMDAEMTELAYSVHDRIVAEEGVDPTSDEYYAEIERQVRAAFPDGWALYMEMADAALPGDENGQACREDAAGADDGDADRAASAVVGGHEGLEAASSAPDAASPKPAKKAPKKKPKEAPPVPQTREQSLDMEFRQLLKRPPAYRRSYSVLTHTLMPTGTAGTPLSPPLVGGALPSLASPWPMQPRQTSAPHPVPAAVGGDNPLSPPSLHGRGSVHRSASSSGRLVASSLTDLTGPRLSEAPPGQLSHPLRTPSSSLCKKPPFDSSPVSSPVGGRDARPSFDNSSGNMSSFSSYSGGGMANVATDADSFTRRREALVAELEQVKREAERERQKIMRQIKKKLVKAQKGGMGTEGKGDFSLRSPSGTWES